MSVSPYAPPASSLVEPALAGTEWDAVYDVGRGQRALLWLMLASFLPFLPLVVRAFIGPVCAVFSYRVARHVYSPIAAVAMALLCGLPLLGLFALAFLNARATRLLRRAGVRVGFMGADVSRLRPASSESMA